MQRGYEMLIKQVLLVKGLIESGDAEALTALYRNVSSLLVCMYKLLNYILSCAKAPTRLEVMMQVTSRPRLWLG